MSTIADALALSDSLDSDTARLDVELLLCSALSCDRTFLRTWPDREINDQDWRTFLNLFEKRKAGQPIAYLVGHQPFWSLDLNVSPETLIPRADTEKLVEAALELALPDNARVLDLGTGTGAIALALASEHENWHVMGVDCAEEIVTLAKANAEMNELSRVEFKLSNWFGSLSSEKYDLIVSNPPYIDEDDEHLELGDVRFEPKRALVADRSGLADIEHIASESIKFMNDGAWLLVEHGYDQGSAVRQIFEDAGLIEVETQKDLGGQERVTLGRFIV